MASDWVHCNKCFRQPQNGSAIAFSISSCVHICCAKCVAASSTEGKTGSNCPVCCKSCSFLEINRHLRADVQQLFRNPRDIAGQYIDILRKVLDFQKGQHDHYSKFVAFKAQRMQSYAEGTKKELCRRAEEEKKALDLIKRAKLDSGDLMSRADDLNRKLAALKVRYEEYDSMLQEIDGDAGHDDFDNLFSSPVFSEIQHNDNCVASPLMDLSFRKDFATSTPIYGRSPKDALAQMVRDREKRSKSLHRPAETGAKFFGTGEIDLSPILPDANLMNTPALLGLRR